MTNDRPPEFDKRVLAYMPRLRHVAARLAPNGQQEDLVQSTIERGLRYWRSYNPEKNLGGWLVYQMRNVAFEERRRPVATGADMDNIAIQPSQEGDVVVSALLRAVEGSPHADVMRLVASGHTSEEIATMHGVSRQRVHQKITAFRREYVRAAA
ncbi:sigma-70 family RNA polymerase sigma factor [Rhizobium leucaenae]|uniref:sigma-70 family RNA polymerase sigma factor n=1 Tax=Rhizobium leucaenae TaxID=29450 RepID=UPI001610E99C|nr:sigma-70 family RNA polymerase sigma factor [Rhizobium leucaenae]MBB6299940.1 RNA polymerase sigma factor (sigma-70 family) [Rhizobium leucaenae]